MFSEDVVLGGLKAAPPWFVRDNSQRTLPATLRRTSVFLPSGTGIGGIFARSPRVKADWMVTNVDRRNRLGHFLLGLSDAVPSIRGRPMSAVFLG